LPCKRRSALGAGFLLLAGLLGPGPNAAESTRRPLEAPISGTQFQSEAIQALQRDDFANPGLLWLDQGRALWQTPTSAGTPSCASCHGDDGAGIRGAAAGYPKFDAQLGRLINVEQRINACRTHHQQAEALPHESEALLALTTFVVSHAAGAPADVNIDGPARAHFDAGRAYYHERRGQLNLACHHCHDRNWGKMLRGDRISQGHGTGYPAYRLEWQTLGSLHRRFRACNLAIRAEPLPAGDPRYVDLELFLAWRAAGLPLEAPAVRR
jgi:sulfur-oxidizing protein SoxA